MSNAPTAARAPAYLRVAVILGATCLLAGLGGLVWLPEPGAVPAFVRIQDVGELTPQVVWEDADGGVDREEGAQGRDPDVWLFYRAPTGVSLELQLVETNGDDHPRVVRQATVVLEPGALFDVK